MISWVFLLASLLGFLLVLGCGAPIKNADEPKPNFALTSDLSAKVNALCATLDSKNSAPNTASVPLSTEVCSNPASNAVDMKTASAAGELGFATVRSEHITVQTDSGKDEKILNIQTRSEFWLNRPILSLLEKLLPLLNDKANDKEPAKEDQKFEIKIEGESVFDKELFLFTVNGHLTSTRAQNGFLNISNDFSVAAQLIDKQFLAATITTAVAPLEESLIRDAKILVLLVPHANDIYLDLSTNINIYSYGEAVDKIIQERLIRVISDAINKIPELLDEAQNK